MNWRSASLLVVAVLALAACRTAEEGPSLVEPRPTATTASTTSTISVGTSAAVEKFGQCLAEQGVDMESAPTDAIGRPRFDMATARFDFDDPEVADAIALCAWILATGALDLSQDGPLRSMVLSQLEAFALCVRDEGVTEFPHPVPGFSGVGSPFPAAEIPYADPNIASAAVVCRGKVLSALPRNQTS